MKRTDKFRFPYLEGGDLLYRSDELQRWKAIDANLGMTADIIGPGVVPNGMSITYSTGNTSVGISSGTVLTSSTWFTTTGNSYVTVQTGNSYTLYAQRLGVTVGAGTLAYTTLSVTFGATTGAIPLGATELGRVEVATLNSATIDETTRTELEFGGKAKQNNLNVIRNHRHRGYPDPAQVDLANHVTGTLSAANIAMIPGDKISSDDLDMTKITIIGDLSHVGRLREAATFTKTECYTQDENYKIYNTAAWTGDIIVYRNDLVVDPSLIAELDFVNGTITFSNSITLSPVDRIYAASNLTEIKPVLGNWDTGLVVQVFVNNTELSSDEFTTTPADGLITLVTPLTIDDVVEVNIIGTSITNVGVNTHDTVDYWLGENTSWMGWWPSYITEFNLNQAAINMKSITATTGLDYQIHQVVLPEDWSTDIQGGTVTTLGTGANTIVLDEIVKINIAPTLPVEPVGGLATVLQRGQSFIATENNVARFVPWLSRVGPLTNYTLVASLYTADSVTHAPTTQVGYVSLSASEVSKYGDKVIIDFTGGLPTVINDKYAVVLEQSGGGINDYVEWWGATEDYPNGKGMYSTDLEGWVDLPAPIDDYYVSIYSHVTHAAGSYTGASFAFDAPVTQNVNPVISIVIDCSNSMLYGIHGGANSGSDPFGERFASVKTFIHSMLDYFSTGSHASLDVDQTVLFDLVVFTESLLIDDKKPYPFNNSIKYDPTKGIYALLGESTNVTNDEAALYSLLDAANNQSYWGNGTPLHQSIKIAAQRLKELSVTDGIGVDRKKAIIVFTDGVAEDNAIQPAVIDYLQEDANNLISVYSIGLGVGSLEEYQLADQAAVLFEYADKTSGRYYSDLGIDSMQAILEDLKSADSWTSGDFEEVYSLPNEVYLESLDFAASIPSSTTATVEIYTAEEAETVVYEQVGSGTFNILNTGDAPPSIPINRFAKHIKFIFHLTAGSIPSITGGVFNYYGIYEDYMYTKPYTAERPIQEISLAFARTPEMMPLGTSVKFAVSPGLSTNWDYMRQLDNYDREIVPGRLKESTTTTDYLTYTLKNGQCVGADTIKVYVNGVVVPESLYRVKPFDGTIRFITARLSTDVVKVSVLYDSNSYRIGIKIKHKEAAPHTDFAFGWIYTTRPKNA